MSWLRMYGQLAGAEVGRVLARVTDPLPLEVATEVDDERPQAAVRSAVVAHCVRVRRRAAPTSRDLVASRVVGGGYDDQARI